MKRQSSELANLQTYHAVGIIGFLVPNTGMIGFLISSLKRSIQAIFIVGIHYRNVNRLR
jgi:hypothetical protein